MSLFSELKQRRVIRVLIGYLVASWVAIEVATTVAPLMGLPDWVPRLVLAIAGAALPAVVLLAWYFDWDAGRGLRRADAPAPTPASRRRQAVAWGLAGLATILLAGAAFGLGRRWQGVAAERPTTERVVVGVFENRTGDEALAPLGQMAADWVTQGLIEAGFIEVADAQTSLAIEQVQATRAGMLSADVLGREAMATLVVRGSYYRSGDSIWINAEVLDVGDGRVVAALPAIAAHRDDPLSGVEAVRQRVVTALALQVDRSLESFEVAQARPPSWSAYSAYMEGLRAYLEDDYGAAHTAFDRAIAHDSTFDSAILWAAHAYWFSDTDTMDARLARLETRRARMSAYDRARLDWMQGFRYGPLERIYQANRAMVAAAPGSMNARRELALSAMRTRRYAEAREIFDSLYPFVGLMRSWSERYVYYTELLHLMGDYEGEEEIALDAISSGDVDPAWGFVARARAAAGVGDARRALALADSAGDPFGYVLASVGQELLGHGAAEEGRRMLERAVERLEAAPEPEPGGPARPPGGGPALLIVAYYHLGRHDEAEAVMDRFEPRANVYARLLITAYRARIAQRRSAMDGSQSFVGRADSLTAFADSIMAQRDDFWWTRLALTSQAFVHIAAMRGERERALELLRISADVSDGRPFYLHNSADPDLASLRGWRPIDALVRGRD